MKLISMTNYILEQENFLDITNKQKLECIIKYANFLKQPLELSMFVPCDEDGNVLEEPKRENYTLEELENTELGYDYFDFQQAKERCLFDINIELSTVRFHITQKRIIEYFTAFEIQLTPTAIKQLGL